MDWWSLALITIFWISLTVSAYYDARAHIIPDVTWILIALSGGILLSNPIESIISGTVTGGVLLLLALINENWVGGGDIKLVFSLGIALGYGVLIILALSSFVALIYGIYKQYVLKNKKPIPFAPFIYFTTIGVVLIVYTL